MRTLITRFWHEEQGVVVSAEIMLIGTILVIGMIVGLKSVRDAVVSELADVAQAFYSLQQRSDYWNEGWGNNGMNWTSDAGEDSGSWGGGGGGGGGWGGNGGGTCIETGAGAGGDWNG